MLYWVPGLVPGFHVDGFGSAFWGAILIGIISWMLSAFFRGSDGRVHVLTHHTQIRAVRGRVIILERGRAAMTYCLGMLCRNGAVFLSDSRTSAGMDNITMRSKMRIFEKPGRARHLHPELG